MNKKILLFLFRGKHWLMFLWIVLFSTISYAQDLKIKGKVTSTDDGTPLPGVSVYVKETKQGTSTNTEGNFALSIAKGSTLVFTFIGYDPKEVLVNSDALLNVKLNANSGALSEIVVVGYGVQKKKDLTGAVSTVSVEQIKDLPVVSVDQKLVGQVAGVQISTTTGSPGGGSTIKIRGSGSIGAGDNPLFVVDGYPISNSSGHTYNPLNVINPDDIESVTILKDASSTAIYGSRGSNGVVVITTKKGKSGEPVVTVNSYAGTQSVPEKGRPKMLNGEQYAQFRKDIITDDFAFRGATLTEADIPVEFRNPSQYGAGTDWYNTVLRTAVQNNLDVGVSGGTDNTHYNFSVGRINQEGTIKYTDFERYAIRANIETNISKKLKVGINLAPTNSVQNRNDFDSGGRDVITRTLWLSPIVPVTDASGNRTSYISSPGSIGAPNPLNSLQFAGTNDKIFRGLGGAFAEYEIIRGLKAKYSYNVDYSSENSFNFNPSTVGGESNPAPVVPNSNTYKNTTFNWLSEMLLSYDKTIATDHRISAVIGYTAQKERSNSISLFADNYPDDLVKTINAASIISSYGEDIQKWSLISYLARLNYSFKDKYLVTATVRTDGSSRFGSNKQYGTFPSAALGWRLSQEDYVKQIKWLSDLKLRASYGKAGNFNIGNYTYTSNIGTANYAFNGNLANGRVSTTLNNPDLTWENSNELDAGVDLGLFKDRIYLNVDYYNRLTKGMLFNSEIPQSSGYSNAIINSGTIRNRGLEIGLSTHNLEGGFKWNTNFNIAFNKNKVLALNANNDPIYSGLSGEGSYTHITQVGHPIGEFYGYVVEGVYKDQADLNNSPKHVTSVVGSIKYKDVDGNGIIEPDKDFAVIGHAQPNFTYGFTNSFSYKRFDLNVIFVGSQGGQELKTANQYLLNIDGVFNVDQKVLNRWRSPSDPGDGMTPTTNGSRVIYRDVNSSWVEDASFLRLQNVTLGYNFASGFLARSKVIKGARFYVSGQNLITFTKYNGNPEANTATGSALTPGEDFTNYPLARTLILGLNLTF
ncbi:TonB-dependent receptor [Pedobacter sp. L105]|uniref:SusC/RagA family TonB-linked outer membrane protein n=1 Tax=Pedobacter sp. L105 TaxID=1641871 RepID=UPI00131AD646|nr:TonB-dependent receptor [Pedobacter sp. L105]